MILANLPCVCPEGDQSSQNVEYDLRWSSIVPSLYTNLDAVLEQEPAKRVTGPRISLWQPSGTYRRQHSPNTLPLRLIQNYLNLQFNRNLNIV